MSVEWQQYGKRKAGVRGTALPKKSEDRESFAGDLNRSEFKDHKLHITNRKSRRKAQRSHRILEHAPMDRLVRIRTRR